jgi:hypothetical protein
VLGLIPGIIGLLFLSAGFNILNEHMSVGFKQYTVVLERTNK